MPPPARTESLDVDTARWLVSAAGRDAIGRAQDLAVDGADPVAASLALRGLGLDIEQVAAAVSAAEAADRMPAALAGRGPVVFTRSALEQASDPAVAAWRARRFAGLDVADLACGAGGDLLALADHARTVVGVDRDHGRVVLAAHNLAACGSVGHVVVGDALRRPVRAGAVHADPSRRVDGRRARSLAEYGPPVGELLRSLDVDAAGIVVSPAVAWSDPDLPADAEVEFVQRGRDLVEGMLWLGDLRRGTSRSSAAIVDADTGSVSSLSAEELGGAGDELPVGAVGSYLLDVAPAVVRARLHDAVGARTGARRIARSRALLTTDAPPAGEPWWDAYRVEAVLPAKPRAVRSWLRSADDTPIEIATAGFDADPDRWWRELGRPPRGPQGRRLLLVRLDAGSAALVLTPCRPGPT